MTTYYTLLIKETKQDSWSIAFGDYNKEVVKDERDDCYDGCYGCKIISTGDTQEAINSKVKELNSNVTI